jgi:hypothetical protein
LAEIANLPEEEELFLFGTSASPAASSAACRLSFKGIGFRDLVERRLDALVEPRLLSGFD